MENKRISEVTEDTMQGRYLTFMIDKETFGIEIRYVTEIVGIQAITDMPDMPDYMKGIINLRGKIIPVMDIRLRFRKEARAYDDRTCVIVTEYSGISVGFIVDSVSEVMVIPEEDISARPSLGADGGNSFINMIGKSNCTVILLVDCGKLLSTQEYESISCAL